MTHMDRAAFDELVTQYIDRLATGEELDPEEVLLVHPDDGVAILEELRVYLDLSRLDDPSSEPPLGTLGDYTLRRQIGRGGMGVVYEAWESSMDRAVALKVLPGAVAADDRAVTRFVREARLAGKLNHPNVVGVYGMGVNEGTPWYSMEYVEGETLAQLLARVKDAEPGTETPFGARDEVAYFANLAKALADVADGLQHAHSKGVTHRDIKPSNLILDSGDRLRILDFGLARLEGQESVTQSGDFVGTPLYMSPEQARRKRIPVDHRTDVYSLGATMYETLCGGPPFRGKDHADTLSQIIERDPATPRKANPRVPKDLETIVLKCLRKDADARYGTAEALGQDLRRFVRGDPIEARPQSEWERLASRLKKHRTKFLVMTALVVLAGLVAWLTYGQKQARDEIALARCDSAVLAALDRIDVGRFSVTAGAGRQRDLLRLSSSLLDPVRPADFRTLIGDEGKRSLREAAAILRTQTAAVPGARDAHYHLARALRLLDDEAGARRELERALEIDPEFLPARFLLDENATWPVDPGGAGSPPGSASEISSSWSHWWLEARAAAAKRTSDGWKRALVAYDRLIDSIEAGQESYLGFPAEAHVSRGVARLETGDLEGAKRDFGAARTLAPRALEPHLLLGKAYFLAGDPVEGRTIFERTHDRRDPGDRNRAALWITAVCISLGEYGEAQRWVGELLDEPAVEERLMTFLYGRQGRWAEAIAAGERAIDRSPADLTANALLVSALIRGLRFRAPEGSEEAVAKLLVAADRARRLDPENPQVRFLERAAVASVRRHLQEFDRSQIMNLKKHDLIKGAVSTLLAGLIATLVQAREVCEDFTVDSNPEDGEPAVWVKNWWNAPAGVMEDAVVAGCGRPGLMLRGADGGPFGLETEEVFAGDVSVRAEVTHCGGEGPFNISVHFDVWSVSGYVLQVTESGRILLKRWDNADTVIRLVESRLSGYAYDDELTLELSTIGNAVRLRVQRVNHRLNVDDVLERTHVDATYRVGSAGFQVGNLGNSVNFHSVCVSDTQSESFRRGDTDGSGIVDISDPIYNLTFQFVGGIGDLPCEDAADVDDSGVIDISDPIYNLTFQFVGGIDPPPAPGGDCGGDPTQDDLTCPSYTADCAD